MVQGSKISANSANAGPAHRTTRALSTSTAFSGSSAGSTSPSSLSAIPSAPDAGAAGGLFRRPAPDLAAPTRTQGLASARAAGLPEARLAAPDARAGPVECIPVSTSQPPSQTARNTVTGCVAVGCDQYGSHACGSARP